MGLEPEQRLMPAEKLSKEELKKEEKELLFKRI